MFGNGQMKQLVIQTLVLKALLHAIGMEIYLQLQEQQEQKHMEMILLIFQLELTLGRLCDVVALGAVGPLRALFVRICAMVPRIRTTTLAFAVAVVNLVPGIWKSRKEIAEGECEKKKIKIWKKKWQLKNTWRR
jgi:hypothetical protein